MKPNKQENTEAETKKPICKMSERQIKEADVLHNRFCVTPPAGTSIEALQNPASWVHLARKLAPRDRIEAMPECGTWMAEFLVMHKTDIGATVVLLHKWDLAKVEIDDKSAYEARWHSPATKYGVFRTSDNECLKNGFETKALAEAHILENFTGKKVA